MAIEIKSSQLSKTIDNHLKMVSKEVAVKTKKIVETTTKDLTDKVRQASPKKRGRYAKGWRNKVVFESGNELRKRVFNKTDYQLTHLLEKGHLRRGGKSPKTKAIPHLFDNRDEALKQMESEIEKILDD